MRTTIPFVQKHCINGINKEDAENLKEIPELDERVTALEQGGTSSNGYTFISLQEISQVKNQIVDYNEEYDVYIAKTNMFIAIYIVPDWYYIPILKNEYLSGNRTIMRTSGNTSTERSIDEYAFIIDHVFDDATTVLPYSLNKIILNTNGTINIQHQESTFNSNNVGLACENINYQYEQNSE